MNKKAKIVVLHMKELLYTGLFFLLGILLVVIVILMFSGKDSALVSVYTPGQYTTTLTLNGNMMDVVVTVDENAITSIELDHLEEALSVMYPLMEPTLEELSAQIIETQSLEDLSYKDDNQYTSLLLLDAIASCLEQAKNPENQIIED